MSVGIGLLNARRVTADTITDEQIRELRDDAWRVYQTASEALTPAGRGGPSYSARARCAEILNARAKERP